jgi:hypothetical protein
MCAANWVRKEPSAAEEPKSSPEFIVAPLPRREMRSLRSQGRGSDSEHGCLRCYLRYFSERRARARVAIKPGALPCKSSNKGARRHWLHCGQWAPRRPRWLGMPTLPDRGRTDACAAAAAVHHVVWCSYFRANQLLLGRGRRPWSRYDAMRNPRSHGLVTFASRMRKRLVSVPKHAYGTFR